MRTPLWLVLLAVGCGSGEEGEASRSAGTLFDAPSTQAGTLPPTDVEVPAGAPTVLFLGDSIAAGLHLAEHQAFPAVLQRRLTDAGLPFRLVSSCESGRTTAGGVTALDWVLRTGPDAVVIQLGGNDGLRGIALEEVETNLRTMIERSLESGARILVLGVRLPPNYGDYAERFDALYPALAEEYGLELVPFFMEGVGGVPDMNLEDGLHPSAVGQERLADSVEPALRALLQTLDER